VSERGFILSHASPERPLPDSPPDAGCALDGLLEFPSERDLASTPPASPLLIRQNIAEPGPTFESTGSEPADPQMAVPRDTALGDTTLGDTALGISACSNTAPSGAVHREASLRDSAVRHSAVQNTAVQNTVPILEFISEATLTAGLTPARPRASRRAHRAHLTQMLVRSLGLGLARTRTAAIVQGRLLRGRSITASRQVVSLLRTCRAPALQIARSCASYTWRGATILGSGVVRVIDRCPMPPQPRGSSLSFVGGMLVGTVAMLIIGVLSGEMPGPPEAAPGAPTLAATTLPSPLTVPLQRLSPSLMSRQTTRQVNATVVNQEPVATSWAGFMSARVSQPSPAPVIFSGSIRIDSQPRGGAVYLNNVAVGTTPVVLTRMRVGSRAVRIERDGHQRWTGVVQIIAGRRTTISASLPAAAPAP
jgi:hypothetical protein